MATRADRIEAAARALLADLEDPGGNAQRTCSRLACDDLALAIVYGDAMCDVCAVEYPAKERHDLSYAPAVRALRAALAEVAP